MGAVGREGDRQPNHQRRIIEHRKTQGCRFMDDVWVNSQNILKKHSGNSHQIHITEGYSEGNGQINVGAP